MKIGASKSPLLIGLIAATGSFAALAAVVRNGGTEAPGPLKPEYVRRFEPAATVREPKESRSREANSPASTNGPEISDSGIVRYVAMRGEELTLDRELTLKLGEDPHQRSLTETVKSLGYADVRILKVGVEKGAATVDVSPSLTNEGFSSSSEAALIEAIARTLGQFSEIQTFVLRIDGEVLDTLGHLELDKATRVIRPDEKPDGSESPSREPTP